MYCEATTRRNAEFYRRHGFLVLGSGRATPGAPPLTLMWRPPAATNEGLQGAGTVEAVAKQEQDASRPVMQGSGLFSQHRFRDTMPAATGAGGDQRDGAGERDP
jgi:hypothetical protein